MELLATPTQAADWLAAHTLPRRGTLRADSRALRAGDAFLAWPGQAHDGRRHVAAALAEGASACLVEADGATALLGDTASDARVATLAGLKAASGIVADLFHGQPSRQLDVLAVTGTNGKTSTAWWLAQALTHAGRRCGVVGTLGVGEPPAAAQAAAEPLGSVQPTGLTSPDALTLHGAFRGFVDAGLSACALEASSIGLVDHRLTGTHIGVALFTNFTRDHLDYHGDMAAYWAAKRRLFDWPGLRAAVVNVDDAQGAALALELSGSTLDLWTVSRAGGQNTARLQARGLRHDAAGLAFDLVEGQQQAPVSTPLVGDYNVSNLLGVVAGLRALGVPLVQAAAALQALSPVPGRLQRARGAGPVDVEVLVDYAHTPDALEKTLQALQPLARARGGRLVCVFGCGGNRDASKRPLMGAIAEREADVVVLTSDNPRLEEPQAILAQIAAGLQRPGSALVLSDRGEAIARSVAEARPGDVLLLAGKGHEDYQDIGGSKRPFSDLAAAQAALALRAQQQGAAA